jgi:hypothetical protein
MAASVLGLASVGCASNPQVATQAPAVQNPEVTSGPITSETHFAAGQLAESQNNLPTAVSQYTEAAEAESPSSRFALSAGGGLCGGERLSPIH